MHLFGGGGGRKFLEERRKGLEKYMESLLACDVVQAHRNPYLLGFLGVFQEKCVVSPIFSSFLPVICAVISAD